MGHSTTIRILVHSGCSLVFLVAVQELAAQSTGREQPGGVLHRLDADGDGMLQPEEVPVRARPLIRRIAERSGLDPNGPLPLDQLDGRRDEGNESDNERPSRGDQGRRSDSSGDRDEGEARNDGDGRGRGDGDEERRRRWWDWADDNRPRQQPEALPTTVPGFGIELAPAKVPGFDVPHSVTSQAGPTLAELEQSADRRTLWFARRLLQMADENGNQIVDPAEWERLRWRGDANDLDANRDGRLTLPELIQGVARQREEREQSRNNGDGQPRGRVDRGGQPGASAQAASGGGENRPRDESRSDANSSDRQAASREQSGRNDEAQNERRPRRAAQSTRNERSQRNRGPSWFRSRDRNRDGQVAMHEYATRWDERIVAEFNARDADGDGVISFSEATR